MTAATGRGVLVLLVVSSAGCATLPVESPTSTSQAASNPLVVAFLDSGINAYHAEFSIPPTDMRAAFLAGIADARSGEAARSIELTRGLDPGDGAESDRMTLAAVERGVLYHIVGTNVLAITFEDLARGETPLIDDSGHGTLVSGVAVRTTPGIVIVSVEAAARPCSAPEGGVCVMDSVVVDAMEWIAEQPWIDIVSLSFGMPGNPPNPELARFAAATRRAADLGMLVVAAGGNVPPPSVAGEVNSPPWIISVGGAQEEDRGAAVLAATYPDVAANYSWTAPSSVRSNGTREGAGTSLAAPRVAGVLAKAIAEVRASWGHRGGIVDGALAVSPAGERASAWDFRAALNASARVWNATDWSPAEPREDPVATAIRSTVPVTSPAAQMGWGFVDNATAHEVAARVLARDFALPAAKEGAHRAGVEGAYAARVAYWGGVSGP